jgi:hypothetical protein
MYLRIWLRPSLLIGSRLHRILLLLLSKLLLLLLLSWVLIILRMVRWLSLLLLTPVVLLMLLLILLIKLLWLLCLNWFLLRRHLARIIWLMLLLLELVLLMVWIRAFYRVSSSTGRPGFMDVIAHLSIRTLLGVIQILVHRFLAAFVEIHFRLLIPKLLFIVHVLLSSTWHLLRSLGIVKLIRRVLTWVLRSVLILLLRLLLLLIIHPWGWTISLRLLRLWLWYLLLLTYIRLLHLLIWTHVLHLPIVRHFLTLIWVWVHHIRPNIPLIHILLLPLHIGIVW